MRDEAMSVWPLIVGVASLGAAVGAPVGDALDSPSPLLVIGVFAIVAGLIGAVLADLLRDDPSSGAVVKSGDSNVVELPVAHAVQDASHTLSAREPQRGGKRHGVAHRRRRRLERGAAARQREQAAPELR